MLKTLETRKLKLERDNKQADKKYKIHNLKIVLHNNNNKERKYYKLYKQSHLRNHKKIMC